jgi:hypothetical protein
MHDVPKQEWKSLAMLEVKARICSRKHKDAAVELEVEAPESEVRRVREWVGSGLSGESNYVAMMPLWSS